MNTKNIFKPVFSCFAANKTLAAIFAVFVVFSFYYGMKIQQFLSNAKYEDVSLPASEGQFIPMSLQNSVSFELAPHNSYWKGVTFFFRIPDAENAHSIGVQIAEKETGTVVFADSVLPEEKLPYYRFTFANALKAQNATYTVTVYGANIELQCSSPDAPTYKLYGNLLGKFLVPLIAFFWIALFAVFAVLFYVFFIKRISAEYVFLIAGSIFALFFMCIMPPLTVGDECRHFDSAYVMSNNILGIDSPDGKILKRVTDLSIVPDDYNQNDNWTYFNYYEELWPHVISELKKPADLSLIESLPYANTLANYPCLYMFSALGITLGRLLHANFLITFLLARFFNTVFFILAVFFALKKLSSHKTFFASFALLPMLLHQVASVSYDSVLISTSLFFIITICSFGTAKKAARSISIKDIIALCIAAIIITPAKAVYFPLLILVVLIPSAAYKTKAQRIIFYMSIGLSMVVSVFLDSSYAALNTVIRHPAQFAASSAAGLQSIPSINDLSAMTSISWIFHHPAQYAYFLMNTLVNRGSYFIETAGGRYLGWEAIPMNELLVFCFIGIFIYHLVHKNEKQLEAEPRSAWFRLITAAVFVFISGAAMTGLYMTGIDPIVPVIGGIQGRYFLPILPLLYLCRPTAADHSESVASPVLFFQVLLLVLFALDLLYRIVGIF